MTRFTKANAAIGVLRRVGATAGISLGIAACGDLLTVTNPGSLQEAQLANPALEQFLINGAIGEFQFAYGSYAYWSGVLADESFTDHHASISIQEVARHDFNEFNGINELLYGNLQRARQSADDAADRVKTMLGTRAASSLNVARALAYGGYAYVLLGEGFCEAPVNLSAPLTSDELLSRAIARFDEAITVAAAAKAGAGVAAEDLISMARVGAARASLRKGALLAARAYADPVPLTYGRWAYYSANSARENNAIFLSVRTTGTPPWLAMHPTFQGLDDPRVPQPKASRLSIASHPIFPPLKPSMYSGWTAAAPGPIEVATHIRFSSGLEARYIVVEADGPTSAMLSFVNERRAVAGKPPVNLEGSALVDEFRMQRALDFYLTGQRLGDLRRYAAAGTDLFPRGNFPILPNVYGTTHCFLVPRSEKSGNPNY
jgi:hypothetical protein